MVPESKEVLKKNNSNVISPYNHGAMSKGHKS